MLQSSACMASQPCNLRCPCSPITLLDVPEPWLVHALQCTYKLISISQYEGEFSKLTSYAFLLPQYIIKQFSERMMRSRASPGQPILFCFRPSHRSRNIVRPRRSLVCWVPLAESKGGEEYLLLQQLDCESGVLVRGKVAELQKTKLLRLYSC
jgi:hypothetical protein